MLGPKQLRMKQLFRLLFKRLLGGDKVEERWILCAHTLIIFLYHTIGNQCISFQTWHVEIFQSHAYIIAKILIKILKYDTKECA